jgi:hypothetical protein
VFFNLYHEFKVSNTEHLLEEGWVWMIYKEKSLYIVNEL